MKFLSALLPLLPLAAAAPFTKRVDSVTAAGLIAISAGTADCNGASFPDECATATQAAPSIEMSFLEFNVTNVYEKAAMIALMIYESGSFDYNKNHYPAPGTPGQGTRNMQSPAFNLLYAKFVVPADKLASVENDPAAVLALVNGDYWSFASAAWFLTTQCTAAGVREQLQTGTIDGWHTYLETCVGTSVNDDRDALWNAAIAQIGTGIN